MKSANDTELPVSANNPCPFLRALVASGQLADDSEPLGRVAEVIVQVARHGEGQPALPKAAILGIAAIANGVGPLAVLRARQRGLRLNALRDGPLDKHGVGSGILNSHGVVDKKQLARLGSYAVPKIAMDGSSEAGLALPELRRFMDDNFKRAAGRRRLVDRALMNGEWPVLLKVMGRDGPGGRFLSLQELEALFVSRRLPERMRQQATKRA
jgi:hypothetical protein